MLYNPLVKFGELRLVLARDRQLGWDELLKFRGGALDERVKYLIDVRFVFSPSKRNVLKDVLLVFKFLDEYFGIFPNQFKLLKQKHPRLLILSYFIPFSSYSSNFQRILLFRLKLLGYKVRLSSGYNFEFTALINGALVARFSELGETALYLGFGPEFYGCKKSLFLHFVPRRSFIIENRGVSWGRYYRSKLF
jgi:hypothetical protein